MMKKTNKTTNYKADTILDVIETLDFLKENDYVQFINYKWDEENNVFHINTIPKQTAKYIEVNFTITPTGCTYN